MDGNQGQRSLIVTGSKSGESPGLVCLHMCMYELTYWHLNLHLVEFLPACSLKLPGARRGMSWQRWQNYW